jgi:hypothetical protein
MAARELERSIREFGLRGAEICSNITGKNLDEKGFGPFYTKLRQLDVPVFIHPSNVLGADRRRPYHLQNLIGNPNVSAVNHPNPSCSSCASGATGSSYPPPPSSPRGAGMKEGAWSFVLS